MDGAGSSLITAISISYIPGGKSHGKPYERRGNQAEGGYGTYGASDGTGGARSATVAGRHKSGSTEPESTAASGTITRYVAAAGETITRYVTAADLDRPDIDAFTASNIFHIFRLTSSESDGKTSSRGRSDSAENRDGLYGASDNATGNVTATNTGNATGNDTETGNDTGTHVSADAAATGGSSGGIYETKQSQIAAEDDASSTVLCDGSRADHICGRTETSSRSG